ncbi:DUF4088 domain-containing protein, partial [Burkholderia pseudomallei]
MRADGAPPIGAAHTRPVHVVPRARTRRPSRPASSIEKDMGQITPTQKDDTPVSLRKDDDAFVRVAPELDPPIVPPAFAAS